MYRYSATDPRVERGRYFYAPFEGAAFLGAYREGRRTALERLAAVQHSRAVVGSFAPDSIPSPGEAEVVTAALLRAGLASDVAAFAPWLTVFIRKFEVARLLRTGYGRDLRPTDRQEVPLDAYAFLAAFLARKATADAAKPDLGALSTLLKVGDLLCYVLQRGSQALSAEGAAAAAQALTTELDLVETVMARPHRNVPVADEGRIVWSEETTEPSPRRSANDRRAALGVTLLAADTARARAYLDLLVANGLSPSRAIVVELASASAAGAATQPRSTPLFDNTTPLVDALERAAIPTTRLVVDRFEDESVLRALERGGTDIVVVAGPPGVLLARPFFGVAGARYLHVHPGRLPAYRGSTQMYYELLAEGRLTATALFLDEGIDTGSIVATRGFERPADLTTIDHAFDPWMRAVVLRDVLRARAAGDVVVGRPQASDKGRTYFVIHPVLRHVALLSR